MERRLTILLVLLLVATPQLSWGQSFLTSGANVRLRSAPGLGSPVVQMLPLGTELELADSLRHDAWLPVRTGSGETGWIDESLVLSISESTYQDVVQSLISSRFDRQGDGFVARAELVALIERVLRLNWDRENHARLELQRLQALAATLQTIPFNRGRWDDRLTTWISERSGEVRYNEPGGEWLIDRDTILRAHADVGVSTVADEIAWLMVQNGLPGECEGVLVCHLEWADKLEGEYLRRAPSGRHVDEAAAQVKQIFDYFTERSSYSSDEFDPVRECDALNATVHSLGEAIRNSSASARAGLVRQLRDMLTLCA